MKQYLSALIQKIGRLNVSIYLLLLSVGYGLYSILPYTLPKIFSGSGGLHVNPFFMVLSILSFLVVPILNYPNNLAMQSVRKYSKQVLFDDLVKKIYVFWWYGNREDPGSFFRIIFLYTKFAVLLRSIYNQAFRYYNN